MKPDGPFHPIVGYWAWAVFCMFFLIMLVLGSLLFAGLYATPKMVDSLPRERVHRHPSPEQMLQQVVDKLMDQHPWDVTVEYECGDTVEHGQTTYMCERPRCVAEPVPGSSDWSTNAFEFDIKYTVSYYLKFCMGLPMDTSYDQFFLWKADGQPGEIV